MKTKNETPINNSIEVTGKKRGRKSKKELLELSLEKKDNIVVLIEEDVENNNVDIINIKENVYITSSVSLENLNYNLNDSETNNFLALDNVSEEINEPVKPGIKKRGRKPKGGKIIQQITPFINNKENKPNIILHLKCSLKDLQTNSLMNSNIEGFNFPVKNNYTYEIIENSYTNNAPITIEKDKINTQNTASFDPNQSDMTNYDDFKENKENDIKEIWKKLKNLQHNLHINNINDKKSACFWCTYEFDSPPVYIPKYFIKESYHVYGCFCSPECATAYLMEENIDSSSKFERYHLINHIYSKIYNYNKNIKPAPNPYFMLEKYYGNLNIQEYRSLFKNERLFLVVDKPLTRILPELHEDNDDFIINNKIIPSNTYHINKKIQKKNVTKNNIMNEKFGLSQQ
jgi:hypothetical protein